MTKGKTSLDKALKYAKKLNKELTAVGEFLNNVNHRLDNTSESVPQNIDTELSYVQVCM